jgi:hypothetical protein
MVMARQQECCPVVGMASRQADAGIAVQKTVITSIKIALRRLQVMVSGFQVSNVIIRCRAFCGCDLDHAIEAWKNKCCGHKIPERQSNLDRQPHLGQNGTCKMSENSHNGPM